jgi:hypothetical protein
MTKADVTFFSIVWIKPLKKRGVVTGFTNHRDVIVSVTAKTAQGKPKMYLPNEVEVIRY